ncbi:hypothetical protein [Aeromonas veronii]|uniref:hypothetical protein n=1 Tax=Aeromonas veronii TaxID=654 RepID=UPI003CE559A4
MGGTFYRVSRAPTVVRPGPVPSPRPRLYRLRQRDRDNGSYTDLKGNVAPATGRHRDRPPRPRAWRSTLLTTC